MLQQNATMTVETNVSYIPQAMFVVYHTANSRNAPETWNQLLIHTCCYGKSLAAWIREGVLVDGCARSYAPLLEAAEATARLRLLRMLNERYDADAVVCIPFTTRHGSAGVMAVLQSAIPQAQSRAVDGAAASAKPHWSEIMFEQNARRLPTTVYSADITTLIDATCSR
ncbi:MAG: hypothetical protein NZ699_16500 [Roseiflexus sp.]|nr:hypothetical protein [Roseiflexus sp.]MCS7290724.1 hypothetical protein [Roseiflexus sp.]MDW8147433.1 hypothetical protein [Roseiflexaceae bacterium]MDW8233714.1 hypothetical protein [Roseiflexaceae bacterium]